MEKLLKPGRLIFAIGFLVLGILCFLFKDFIVGRPPAWPTGFNVNPALGYVSGSLLVICALTILINKKGSAAALLIAILILMLSLSRSMPNFMADWANVYKSMALLGGALIVVASFLRESGDTVNKKWINIFVFIGTALVAAFFICGGYAHFKYGDFVDALIPNYIPVHRFWTNLCGVCLFAGGVGILVPVIQKWVALFSGVMVAGWFLLLHIPRFIADTSNVSDTLGLCESFTFVGIFFVLAGMFAKKK